jgi:alkylation response protein AidB-like acyl-CoA dehydrogenase
MRSAGTRAVALEVMEVDRDMLIGAPGDYMRQPEISLGAWRTLAVIVGVLEALTGTLREGLLTSRRDHAPAQRARLAQALVAERTARLWLDDVAVLAEADAAGEDAAAQVKLARLAITDCCEQALRLVPRSLGLSALRLPHPAERLGRDLATYLRQPALDEVADEAAAHVLARGLP